MSEERKTDIKNVIEDEMSNLEAGLNNMIKSALRDNYFQEITEEDLEEARRVFFEG